MIKVIKTSQPWLNYDEKKNINLALKGKSYFWVLWKIHW